MNISEILKNNPELADNLTLKVNAADLQDFAEMCINMGRQEKKDPVKAEEYLTPEQFSNAIQISMVTLWNWDKRGITKPLRIGNAKRYRRSDIDKILSNV